MTMSKQATIRTGRAGRSTSVGDIARMAGVSMSAVYMGLRGDPTINSETRERIRAVAEHLNYRPRASARALATGRSDMVGVVFANTEMQRSSFWFAQYSVALETITEVLDIHDFAMSVVSWSDEREELRVPKLFRENGVDGLIVLNTPETPVLEAILGRYAKPYVMLDAAASRNRVTVAVDEMRAAEMAVERLVALGHRRIAYLPMPPRATVPVEYIPLREEQFPRGYVRAMAAAGLPPIPGWDQPGDFIACLDRLYARDNPPSALIAYNDALALDAIEWLGKRGLSVPGHVSLVALQYTGVADRCSYYQSAYPDIACKANLQKEMAQVGVQMLLNMIEQPNRPKESQLIEPVLEIRASMSRAPGHS